ncbi:MAG: LytTR family transcriptional regulator DNA-binding domain-containing protein [Clostridiales Family XIII bacterium]|nr:LytTR family transcriptional regulator DNA-binding domain-containing protein [Clostridiales Family XIII bacterium]
MKLLLHQCEDIDEPEVEIRFTTITPEIQKVVQYIEGYRQYLRGEDRGGIQYKIRINDIYYIEIVDKKTLIYTKDDAFQSDLKLYQLLDQLRTYNFVQISKARILNIDTLTSVRYLINSRMEATLINGDKVEVSRTYIPQLKQALYDGGISL